MLKTNTADLQKYFAESPEFVEILSDYRFRKPSKLNRTIIHNVCLD